MAGDTHKIPNEAAVWLARLERGLLPEEGLTLRTWLNRPAHREAIVSAAKLWHGPDILAVLAELVPVGFGTQPPPIAKSRLRPVNVLIALCVALVTVAPFFYIRYAMPSAFASQKTPPQHRGVWGESVYTTRSGETRIVALVDGSTVTLNGHSQLDVLFSAGSRLVNLDYGEAIFHIAGERRPFELNAAGRHFLATASIFDIRIIREQALELMVIEGRVNVQGLPWRWPTTPAQARLFDPRAFVDTSVGPLQAASLEDALFSSYPLTAAAAEVRLRWRPEEVVYVTP